MIPENAASKEREKVSSDWAVMFSSMNKEILRQSRERVHFSWSLCLQGRKFPFERKFQGRISLPVLCCEVEDQERVGLVCFLLVGNMSSSSSHLSEFSCTHKSDTLSHEKMLKLTNK